MVYRKLGELTSNVKLTLGKIPNCQKLQMMSDDAEPTLKSLPGEEKHWLKNIDFKGVLIIACFYQYMVSREIQ